MSKGRDSKKEVKKKSEKTLKEKRKEKKEKKANKRQIRALNQTFRKCSLRCENITNASRATPKSGAPEAGVNVRFEVQSSTWPQVCTDHYLINMAALF